MGAERKEEWVYRCDLCGEFTEHAATANNLSRLGYGTMVICEPCRDKPIRDLLKAVGDG